MKLKHLLQYRYRFVYIAVSLTLVILIQNHLIFVILGPFYIYYLWKYHDDLVKISLYVVLVFELSKYTFDKISIINDGQLDAKVIEITKYEDYYKIVARKSIYLVNIYLTDADDVLIGSSYTFYGTLEDPINNTIPNTFNYKNYLYSHRTKYILFSNDHQLISTGYSIYSLREIINSYIENQLPASEHYIKTFILADKSDIDQNVRDSVNTLGISHMFAVSGYHIGLLVVALTYILKYFRMSEVFTQNFIIILLVLYMIITAFTPSVVRASLMYFGIVLNRRYNFQLSVIDLLSIIYIVLIVINPYIYFNIGFVLSFYITFLLILSQQILKGKSKFETVYYVSFIAFIGSLPIVINMNYQINLLTLIFNILLIYIMSVVILPLSYLTFVFPLLDSISGTLFNLFDRLIVFLSSIDIFIIFGYISISMIFIIINIFIMFLFVQMEKKSLRFHYVFILIILLFVSFNIHYINPTQEVVFLDVDGDSTLIRDHFNQCNIIIDTGEYDSYDTLINYLLSIHIQRIDYLIITHFHSDHYGEGDDIINAFDVANIITNKNVNYFEGNQIQCGDIGFYIYPLSYDSMNENNNSIVLSLFINSKHFLFVGDSEAEREQELMDINIQNVDYLKVGHHGSITSSAEEFIDYINPEEAIIIVHRDNSHGHPSDIVIQRYIDRGIAVYRTDELGTIKIQYLFGKERKKYYSP